MLISGGVDSSVALARLCETVRSSGEATLTAYYLKIWLEDELAYLGDCPWEDDLRYARAVCETLDVPLNVVPLQEAYHERVVSFAIAELARGRTPSPDIHCNAEIKFGAFLDAIDGRADCIATGHYARRVETPEGRAQLHLAADKRKDQTYFLSGLSQAQLDRVRFPIADLDKSQLRAHAAQLGLATHARPDSQGICFLGRIKYPDFVAHHLGARPGDIRDIDTGMTLGPHQGVWFHTIGQRRGLGLGGGPWFVVGKDLTSDTLWVAHADRYARHQRLSFDIEDVHWIGEAPSSDEELWAKVRHGPKRVRATLGPATEPGRLAVTLEEPDQGIAPGQSCVLYRRDRCLGRGVIAGTHPAA